VELSVICSLIRIYEALKSQLRLLSFICSAADNWIELLVAEYNWGIWEWSWGWEGYRWEGYWEAIMDWLGVIGVDWKFLESIWIIWDERGDGNWE
jgi:hypothetical protein